MNNFNFNVCWITLNRSCNLRCFFCYAKETVHKEIIDFHDAKKIIDFCIDAKIDKVIFIGGEPTLYPQLSDLIFYAHSKSITTALVTNGIKLADIEYCRTLKNAGLDEIDLSLKGNDKEDFLQVTGADLLHKVLTAMENLNSLSMPFSCSMVITSQNVKTFLKGASLAFQHKCIGLSLSFAYEFCTLVEKDKSYLQKTDPLKLIDDFVRNIDDLNELSSNKWSFESGYPLCLYSKEQIEKFDCHLVTTCQLLTKTGIIFDTNLNILPCNTMHTLKIGKLGEDFNSYDEFCQYANTGLYPSVISALTSLPSLECNDCSLMQYCGGGCVCFWTNTSFDDVKSYKLSKEVH